METINKIWDDLSIYWNKHESEFMTCKDAIVTLDERVSRLRLS